MTVKTEPELNLDFADAQFRTITAQKLRDFVDSRFAVGGIMYCQDQNINITTGVTEFNAFTDSLDTKGVDENFATGEYTVQVGAGGSYSMSLVTVIEAPGDGAIEFGLTKNGVVLPFRCGLPMLLDTPIHYAIIGGTSVVAGDTLGVKWQGSGNAPIIVHDAQFRVVRA